MEASPTAELPLRGYRALVVDDSESTCTMLARILERSGMEVTKAGDGTEAIARVREEPAFDVILMDLLMNTMDGIETMQRLRPLISRERTCIVPMSATFTEDIERRCRAAGIGGEMLHKPYRPTRVLDIVRGALRLHAPAGAAAEKPAMRLGAPVLPNLRGCDIAAALERCGHDASLLLSLVRNYQNEGFASLQLARDALHAFDLASVLRRLHKVRGEVLNLGMLALGTSLLRLEGQIRQEFTSLNIRGAEQDANQTQPLKLAQMRTYLDGQIAALAAELQQKLMVYARLPGLQQRGDLVPVCSAEAAPVSAEFAALVALVRRRDAAALLSLKKLTRLMPPTYSDAQDLEFRRRIESLDFNGALLLLQARDLAGPAPAGSEQGNRILVVDDAELSVKLLCDVLEGIGTIRFALSTDEALEIATEWVPDLILMDVNMGDSSGIELCRRIKSTSRTAHCVVVLLSSDVDAHTEISGLTAGALDFLEKPINPARVVGRIRAHLFNARRQAATMTMLDESAVGELTGFVACELDGRVREISPSLTHFLSISPQDILGKGLAELFDGERASEIQAAFRRSIATGRFGPIESMIANQLGCRLPVRMVGRQVSGADGARLWVSVEEIQDRVVGERIRIESQVSKSLATMTGGIAHEINNQLAVVIGNIDLALEEPPPARMQQLLSTASAAALRAASISRRMSEMSQRVAFAVPATERIGTLIERLWPLLVGALPSNVSLVRQGFDEDLSVQIDPEGLRCVIGELIDNACDAMSAGGVVAISCRSESIEDPQGIPRQVAVLGVSDSGCGMDEETRVRAFDPFYTTKAPGHSGLGLAQVLGFVTRHEGSVELRSECGIGTLVELRFPTMEPAMGQRAPRTSRDMGAEPAGSAEPAIS